MHHKETAAALTRPCVCGKVLRNDARANRQLPELSQELACDGWCPATELCGSDACSINFTGQAIDKHLQVQSYTNMAQCYTAC
jgi:hypothetical protein